MLTVEMQIKLAGMAMEEEEMAQWWDAERDDLLKLVTWGAFEKKVLEKWAPTGWKISAYEEFHRVHQKGRNFAEYLAEMNKAKVALTNAGPFWKVGDGTFLKTLLFNSDDILLRRVLSSTSFDLETSTSNDLVRVMSTAWSGLVAEGLVHVRTPTIRPFPPAPVSSTSAGSSRSPSGTTANSFVPALSPSERERLRAAGGCFRCRHTPASPGWVKHDSSNCPGDPVAGIPPRPPANQPIAMIAAPYRVWQDYDREADTLQAQAAQQPVMAIFPQSAYDKLSSWGSSDEDDEEDSG